MFKEIEDELLSFLKNDTITKIAHMPTMDIAKTMDLLYNIKFENIQRVYTDNIAGRMTVIVDINSINIVKDACLINGKPYYITFIPLSLLNTDESNAVALSNTIVTYVANRVLILMDEYKDMIDNSKSNNTLYLTFVQSIPVIACSILRKIYSGPTLAKLIYMAITEINTYKNLYTEEGINSLLDLFDEGLGVTELLDNGFICSIKNDDKKYPGLWNSLERNVITW